MPRPARINEKSKDFKGSMKRLFKSLANWRYILIIALFLAAAGSILSIIAPNRLSKLTDVITEGIKPNTKNLELISKEIGNNFKEEKIKQKIPVIMMDKTIIYLFKNNEIKIIKFNFYIKN